MKFLIPTTIGGGVVSVALFSPTSMLPTEEKSLKDEEKSDSSDSKGQSQEGGQGVAQVSIGGEKQQEASEGASASPSPSPPESGPEKPPEST